MATLTGQTIASTYDSLLKITDNEPITSTLKLITDGVGNNTVLELSTLAAKVNGNLTVTGSIIGGGLISGTLTTNYIPKATGSSSIGNSLIYDNGTGIGINTTLPEYMLDVTGTFRITGSLGSIFTTAAANELYFSRAGANYILATNASGSFGIYTGGTILGFFQNSAGRVLINTTTDNTTGAKLQVNGGITYLQQFNRQTASYTLALSDQGDTVEMNVATANNLTVPLNSSIALPIGTQVDVIQYGAGQTTIVATGGVTLRSAGNRLKLTSQYSACTLLKVGTDEWYVVGDLSA